MRYLLTVLILSFCMVSFSQTASQIRQTRTQKLTQIISPNNPWMVGAKLSFAVQDLDGGLEDNFIFSGKALAMLAEGEKYGFPVYGSIGLGSTDIFSSESGFNVGVFPYHVVGKVDNFEFTVFSGLGYKIIPALDSTGSAFYQFKASLGVEVAFYATEGSLPTTLSISPTFLGNGELPNTQTLDFTLLLPVGNGVGILAEYQLSLKETYDSIFRVGIVTAGIL